MRTGMVSLMVCGTSFLTFCFAEQIGADGVASAAALLTAVSFVFFALCCAACLLRLGGVWALLVGLLSPLLLLCALPWMAVERLEKMSVERKWRTGRVLLVMAEELLSPLLLLCALPLLGVIELERTLSPERREER